MQALLMRSLRYDTEILGIPGAFVGNVNNLELMRFVYWTLQLLYIEKQCITRPRIFIPKFAYEVKQMERALCKIHETP